MAITAGDFTPSNLAITIKTAAAMWTDQAMRSDFVGEVETWKAIKKEQNAKVSELQELNKKRSVRVHWINSCGTVATDCAASTDDCDLAGPELGTDSKDYGLTFCKEYKFTVDEMTQRTNEYTFEQVVAIGMLKGDKALSEAITASGLARIESFKGVNKVTNGVGTVNGVTTETDIAAADWDSKLFAYLTRVAIQNYQRNSFLLSGSNLFEDDIITRLSQANSTGKGDANLFKMIRTYFDLFNVDAANNPNYKTYLINRGAVAFASKVNYGASPTVYNGAGQMRFSVASKNLPGVRFDVFYTNRCTGKTIKHDYKMLVDYDYFINPTGCDGTQTGVLAFNKV